MAPLCGSLEHTHTDVEIINADHHRGEQQAPRLSLQVGRLCTLCIRYLRPLPSTQNTGCPHDGVHHLWCRAQSEGLPCATCASILLWPASPQQGWGRTVAQVQIGVKIPALRAQEGRWSKSPLPSAPSPTAAAFTSPCLSSRTEEQDRPGGVGLAWIPLHFSCLLVFSCTFICGMLYLPTCFSLVIQILSCHCW